MTDMKTNDSKKLTAKLAAIQITTGLNVEKNLAAVELQIQAAAKQGANIIALPEVFACYDSQKYLALGRQEITVLGTLRSRMSAWAKNNKVYLIGGTIPVLDPQTSKVYPRCYFYNDEGEELGYYDKLHLFDVDVDDAQGRYRESDMFLSGDEIKVFPTPYGNVGLTICYDLRFPYLFDHLRKAGADIISVVAAFTETTGKAHWQTLLQARAIEQQCYVLAANQWGQHDDKRRTFGHSMVISPWGEILDQLPTGQGIAIAEIDLSEVERIRRKMPIANHQRTL
ncbi:MAG: carbon-nitrogen hydrolase family protein [Oleispira antarctica]|nr:carbon-nitrogen hydrolase family protein [Oleispira antarctica]MBQ0791091.1 carbon-nitrogen hydrolase family protein [Oleispira antarctica]